MYVIGSSLAETVKVAKQGSQIKMMYIEDLIVR